MSWAVRFGLYSSPTYKHRGRRTEHSVERGLAQGTEVVRLGGGERSLDNSAVDLRAGFRMDVVVLVPLGRVFVDGEDVHRRAILDRLEVPASLVDHVRGDVLPLVRAAGVGRLVIVLTEEQ